ncbi:hypothetical protein BH11MYX1_BH11MYX1_18330 [soil metagenome]
MTERLRVALREVSTAASAFSETTTNFDELLKTITRSCGRAVDAMCTLGLFDEDAAMITPVAAFDDDPALLAQVEPLLHSPRRVEQSLAAQLAPATGNLFVPRVDLEQLRGRIAPDVHAFMVAIGARGFISIAMRVRGETLGVLTVMQHDEARPPLDELDREVVTHLANLAGLAISNARLFRRVQLEHAERRSAEAIAEQLRTSEAEALAARDEARAANTELEAFSYAVSHDLRAPLRSIDGFSQALLEDFADSLGEVGRSYAIRVRNAATRMSGLIDDLLKLSRVTRTTLRRQQVDLGALFDASAAELSALEPHRTVELVVTPALHVHGDPKLLAIAFDNLVANAWKFTAHAAHPRIELSVSEVAGETVFCISDNGVGFDMTYRHKLFVVFNRLHADSEFAGTGVGLATVQRIIGRHGGRVWADGEVGKGARFFFTLGDTKGPS